MIELTSVGFVLKKTDYQDNDAIFNVLTKDGKITFKGRGINKITSKNSASCNFFMVSEFVTSSKSELSNKTLKSSSVIKLYKKPYEDLLVSSCYLFICSTLDLVSDQINGYEMALECFDMLEEGNSPISILNYFLKHLLVSLGYESNLKGCVSCNKKSNLISFNPESGGFICSDCFDVRMHEKMPTPFLQDVYIFLKNKEYYEMNDERALKLFKIYVSFINDVVGLNMSSSEFVFKCI